MNDVDDVLVLDEEIFVAVVSQRADVGLGALLRLRLRDLSALEFIVLLLDDLVGDLGDGSQLVLAADADVARVDPRQSRDHCDERDAEQDDDSQEMRANRSKEPTELTVWQILASNIAPSARVPHIRDRRDRRFPQRDIED